MRKLFNLIFITLLLLLMVSCAGDYLKMPHQDDATDSKGLVYIHNGMGKLTVKAENIPEGFAVGFYYSEDKWDDLSNWSEIRLTANNAQYLNEREYSGQFYYFTRVFNAAGKMVSSVQTIGSLTDTFRVYNKTSADAAIETTITISLSVSESDPDLYETTISKDTPDTEFRTIKFTDMRSGADVCTYGYYTDQNAENPITFPINKEVPKGSAGPYYADDFGWYVGTKRPSRTELKYAEIRFPETREIPEGFLQGYGELREVVVTSNIERVGKLAFDGCKHLYAIAFDEGIKEIGEAAFHACAEMKSITLPNSLEELGDDAFSECYRLDAFTDSEGHETPYLIRNNIMMEAA
ncbi:MAG: leucine-rich repeat protein, partial [Spirochaetales bacterium]|nr:leucine-rich repeat protein [Candidatus Physcosoma equi]